MFVAYKNKGNMKTVVRGILSNVQDNGKNAFAVLNTFDGQQLELILKPVGLKILKGYAERAFTVRVKGWMQEEAYHTGFHVTNLTGYLKAS
ncbi:hypothetical protein AVL50_04915 [Flammeovirga sp. SJP92]|nr:hypothetical protein AVL50_04915 [Flammeovirga sp. SJP92]